MKYLVIFLSTLFSIYLCEIIVRKIGIVRTYTEINFGTYNSPFSLPVIFPPGRHHLKTPEFEFEDVINDYGLREDKIPPKSADKFRILILGDSFTFGMGVPRNQNWIELTKRKIANDHRKIELINAGQPGADIASAQKFYYDSLRPIKPDMVIYILNTSDIFDFMTRGDETRYKTGVHHPFLEPYWQKSHLVRLILQSGLGYDMNFMSRSDVEETKLMAYQRIPDLAVEFSNELAKNGIKFSLFYHPLPSEMKYEEYNVEFRSNLKKIHSLHDMNDQFFARLKTKTYTDYAYDLDGHFNKNGYFLFSEIFYKELDEELKRLAVKF